MDSGSLSSLSGSDSECALHGETKVATVTIRAMSPIVALLLPPSNQTTTRLGVQRFEEKWTQTDFDLVKLTDKCEATEDFSCFADLAVSDRVAEYDESAFERILRHLSANIHRKPLEQWLSASPTAEASFFIQPVTTGSQRILRAQYNAKHKSFVLLLQCSDQLIVEVRSFTNLLRSTATILSEYSSQYNYQLTSEQDYITILSDNGLMIISINDLSQVVHIQRSDIVSVIYGSSGVNYCTVDGDVFEIVDGHSKRCVRLSPLFRPVFALVHHGERLIAASANYLAVFRRSDPLDYETYHGITISKLARIVPLSEEFFVLFDKKSQRCSVFDFHNPRQPSHTFVFSSSEYTVDVSPSGPYLFSLTSGGLISRWRLLPNCRKLRDNVFNAQLPHCKKLLQTHLQKFVIQTTNRIYFTVFLEQ